MSKSHLRKSRGDRLIELVNQAEHEPVVLAEQRAQLMSGTRARSLLVGDPTADERPPDLVVQVFTVRHHDEGEVARDDAADLLGEEGHRVRLAAALRMPEDAEATKVRVRLPDQRQVGVGTLDVSESLPEGIGRRRFGHPFQLRSADRVFDRPLAGRELALQLFLVHHRGDGVVHTEHLVVAGDNLARSTGAAVIEEDKVLDQVEQR